MDIGSILFIAAILFFVAFYLARPIFEGAGKQLTPNERKLSALQARREQVLNAIHDMDIDRTMGKINREDYEAQRAVLTAEGVSILREIDTLEAALEAEATPASAKAQERQLGNSSMGQATSESTGDSVGLGDEEILLEQEIHAAKTRLVEKPARFCPQCGSEVLPSDRFCTHCGASLEPERSNA
jgi:hypothetical protein